MFLVWKLCENKSGKLKNIITSSKHATDIFFGKAFIMLSFFQGLQEIFSPSAGYVNCFVVLEDDDPPFPVE